MPRQTPFTEQVRKLFLASGYSQVELQNATGLDRGTVSRFANGKQFLGPDSLNKVAEFLGLEVTMKDKKHGNGG